MRKAPAKNTTTHFSKFRAPTSDQVAAYNTARLRELHTESDYLGGPRRGQQIAELARLAALIRMPLTLTYLSEIGSAPLNARG